MAHHVSLGVLVAIRVRGDQKVLRMADSVFPISSSKSDRTWQFWITFWIEIEISQQAGALFANSFTTSRNGIAEHRPYFCDPRSHHYSPLLLPPANCCCHLCGWHNGRTGHEHFLDIECVRGCKNKLKNWPATRSSQTFNCMCYRWAVNIMFECGSGTMGAFFWVSPPLLRSLSLVSPTIWNNQFENSHKSHIH